MSLSSSPLTTEQAETADRIFQSLRQAVDSDLRSLAELLASKPDRQLLGQTEFEVRDRVHKIGAKAIQTALNERKKGGTEGPA
jgi:16S rRNA C1402 N4-methylase RsmH